jgi:hypothetical protein
MKQVVITMGIIKRYKIVIPKKSLNRKLVAWRYELSSAQKLIFQGRNA